jgi:hypothetical protein
MTKAEAVKVLRLMEGFDLSIGQNMKDCDAREWLTDLLQGNARIAGTIAAAIESGFEEEDVDLNRTMVPRTTTRNGCGCNCPSCRQHA